MTRKVLQSKTACSIYKDLVPIIRVRFSFRIFLFLSCIKSQGPSIVSMTSRLISLGTKALAIGGAGVGAAAWWHYQAVLREESNLPTNELWSFSHLQPSTADKKQCIIIGGGVVGITAAYKLAVKGHSVVLLEPNSAPGKEVSTLTCVDLF